MRLFAVLPLLAIVGVQATPTKTGDQVLDNRGEQDFQKRWWHPTPTHREGWGKHSSIPSPSMPVGSAIPSHISAIPSQIPKGSGHGWGGKGGKGGKGDNPWNRSKAPTKPEEWYEKHDPPPRWRNLSGRWPISFHLDFNERMVIERHFECGRYSSACRSLGLRFARSFI
ncbi:hypothetical protein AC578_3781 [Pseudocercospora eumusae]|uniref:Uncharacterized protein n=1 Tax=Pseudocercospora eumusae TaxID=321146 RepID=A0A139HAK6_9PEZI|nr:hypothetical protein AC578_3781 [Pseudocercospora eumusae]